MMRRVLVAVSVAVVLAGGSLAARAQGTVDVVYLKNGSVIRGSVIEEIPGKTIKIQTADGSVFVYQMDQVVKVTKAPAIHQADAGGSSKTTAPSAPAPGANILINPLGVLQFGPIVALEIEMNPRLYFALHARYHGAGALSYLTDWGLTPASFAGGAGVRYFFRQPGISGEAYIAFTPELGLNSYGDGGTVTYVTVLFNAGYRWWFGDVLMNVGADFGGAFIVATSYVDSPAVEPFGMLELSFGWGL